MTAFSSSERSLTISHSSSNDWTAKRKPPPVKKPLPPRQASGAFSSTSTRAPCSWADRAAHIPALPPPTTMTSYRSLIPSPIWWLLLAGRAGAGDPPEHGARHEPAAAGVIDVEEAAHHLAAGVEPRDGLPPGAQDLRLGVHAHPAEGERDAAGHGIGHERRGVERLRPVG